MARLLFQAYYMPGHRFVQRFCQVDRHLRYADSLIANPFQKDTGVENGCYPAEMPGAGEMPGNERIAHLGDIFIVTIDHIILDDGLIG